MHLWRMGRSRRRPPAWNALWRKLRRSSTTRPLRQAREQVEAARAERDELDSATHRAPAPPPWRPARGPERAGAPLYLLCDFRVEDGRIQAAVEAALESSGLLDAWVLPGGAVLDARTLDVVLRPQPRGGATLADVLVATEAGGVGA